MRVAIFTDNFYPELGGLQDSVAMLARGLGERGHTVRVYAPKASTKDFALGHLSVGEIDLGPNVTIERVFSFHQKTAVGQTRAVIPTGRCYFSLKKFKPDIIHTNACFGMGLEALWGAKFLRVPLVGTNHTASTEFVKNKYFSQEFSEKYSLKFVSWFYNHCDFVTAPSESVFTEMTANGFSRPHQVVSNPIDTKTFFLADENTKKQLKQSLGVSPHTFVFAARFSPEKNIDVLVKALALIKKKIPDAMLALAGHGTEQERLEILANDLGVKENLKFFGTLSKAKLCELYQASDVFAIASTCETQGLVMMQAFACGLPAVGVSARGLAEYINDENGILVSPYDPKALAQEIAFLFENPSKRTKLGEGAYQFVQQFSIAAIIDIWENLYAKLVKKD